MRKAREIALRFELDPQERDRLAAILAQHNAKPSRDINRLSLYLDTPDMALANRGWAFGIRRNGGLEPGQLKSTIAKIGGGVSVPQGWTRFIEPLVPNARQTARREAQGVLQDRATQQRLSVVFSIEEKNRKLALPTFGPYTRVSFDDALISAPQKQARLAFLTCSGRAASVANVLLLLARPDRATPDVRTKLRPTANDIALRGYRLAGGPAGMHVTAFAPVLDVTMNAATAFQTIARAVVDQFLFNEAIVRERRDHEAVHQCRVALRRLSAAFKLFSPLISGEEIKALRGELRQLAVHLRNARDLDVVLAGIATSAATSKARAAAADLRKAIELRRNSAYDDLVAVLAAPKFTDLLLRLVVWIESGDWTEDVMRAIRRREPVDAFLARKFAKTTRKFRERCAEIETASPIEQHRVRIETKNLRYGAEFFENLTAAEPASKATRRKDATKGYYAFIKALKDLQTTLGDMNDARMKRQFFTGLALEMSKTGDPQQLIAVPAAQSAASTFNIEADPESFKKIGKSRQALAEVKPFWEHIPMRI